MIATEPLYVYLQNDLLHCLYRKAHPLSATLTPVAGHLSGKALLMRGVPESAIPVMICSLSTGTLSQYDYGRTTIG